MEAIGAILVLFSFGVFLWAVVGLINPVWARLPHRMMSVAVWALSAVLAVAGSSLLPSDDSTEGTESGVGVSAPASNPATESEPPPAPAAPLPQAAVADAAVSDISFEEIDDQFRAGGPLTELQKDERWKEYQGKCVEWRGELTYLTEGFLGGLSIGFKHRRDTFTYDVLISAPRSEKEMLLTWQQGSTYIYRATLRGAPGAILPLSADWGC